jgi:hypothetical protein
MSKNRVNPKELNELAKNQMEALEALEIFKTISLAEDEFYNYVSFGHKKFYGVWQNKMVKVYGHLRNAYGSLNFLVENYVAIRKAEMLVDKRNIQVNGELVQLNREPGDALLTEFAMSEISELVKCTSKIDDWIARTLSIVQTSRNCIGSTGVS